MPDVPLARKIVSKFAEFAEANEKLFLKNRVFTVNLMSSPGSGKTSLIERTIPELAGRVKMAVIEGDIETDRDARRIRALGIKAVQITTHGACHLDAKMISNVLEELSIDQLDLLLIENVGNLVCPANFFLGEDTRVVVASVPEGDDKPLKYPEAFHGSRACVINKIDLAPYVNFDLLHFKNAVRAANPRILTFETSCRTGAGITEWCRWLEEGVTAKKSGLASS